jgi:uncharacterized membrane protein YgaE (UPF0421/DUF939 family)
VRWPPDPGDLRAGLGRRARDPIFWNDALQLAKTAAAAVVAWVLAAEVAGLPQPFLAPWAALLVVHATVYRSFSDGAQQVAATTLGVVLAWAVGVSLGLSTASVAAAIVVGLVLGSVPWLRDQATLVAATALIVLTTGLSTNDQVLLSRLADTAIGISVGLAVNAVVWPPLRRRTAIAAMDRIDDGIATLLVRVHDDIRAGCDPTCADDWVEASRDLEAQLDDAWALVRQTQESARMNPRRSARRVRQPAQWFTLLRRMEQAIAETRSMARTLGRSLDHGVEWDVSFREGWLELLRRTGDAVAEDEQNDLLRVRMELDALVRTLQAEQHLPRWPEYGALLLNLRNVVDTMEDVAASDPFGQPSLPAQLAQAKA